MQDLNTGTIILKNLTFKAACDDLFRFNDALKLAVTRKLRRL